MSHIDLQSIGSTITQNNHPHTKHTKSVFKPYQIKIHSSMSSSHTKHTKAVFKPYQIKIHSSMSSSQFHTNHCICLHDTFSYWNESFQNKLIPVLALIFDCNSFQDHQKTAQSHTGTTIAASLASILVIVALFCYDSVLNFFIKHIAEFIFLTKLFSMRYHINTA